MTTLRRKLLRDIGRQRGQFVAIVALVLLGTALFVGSYDAYRNLDLSYRTLFDQLRSADVQIAGGDTTAIAADVRAVDGVTAVATRTVVEAPVRIGEDALIGRLVGVPSGAPAAVDRVEVLDGRRLDGSDGALVEQHLAAHFDLGPGDEVRVRTSDGWHTVPVTGVAASTEYLWPARSRQEVFITPDSFGVLFVPEPLVAPLAGGPNEVLVRTSTDGRAATLDRIARLATRAGAASIVPRSEQASNAVLQEDIEGFQELAAFFPLLFLTGAAMATAVLLRRRVAGERAIIGTLRANGVTRRQVLGHYLSYGVAAGTLGGVLGAPLGLAGARVLTEAYTAALDLPSTVIEVHPESIAAALAFGVVTGVVAAWAPARTAARLAPAEAMRGIVPDAGRGGVAARRLPGLDRLPVTWRLVLRNPWRHPGRTASTMLGVVLALLLILVSAGMIDTVRALIDRQFSIVDRTDATAVLDGPVDAAQLRALTAVDGVAAAEPVGQAAVTLVAHEHRYSTNLRGFATDTAMHRFADRQGRIALPADGVLLGAAARDELDVTAGDVVTVLDADGAALGDVTVRGFVDEPLGTPAYVSLATFRDLAGQSAVRAAALRYDDGESAAAVTARVEGVAGVLAAVRTAALEDLAGQFLGLFYAFVGAMLLCGGLLAFGILYTTMSANLSERTTEVAMLRASGVRRHRLAGLITAENLLITLVGVVPGIVLGWLAAREALAAYTSDLWRFDLTMSPWTIAAAAGGIVVAALLSQVPGLRALRRVDIAQTVRRRAT